MKSRSTSIPRTLPLVQMMYAVVNHTRQSDPLWDEQGLPLSLYWSSSTHSTAIHDTLDVPLCVCLTPCFLLFFRRQVVFFSVSTVFTNRHERNYVWFRWLFYLYIFIYLVYSINVVLCTRRCTEATSSLFDELRLEHRRRLTRPSDDRHINHTRENSLGWWCFARAHEVPLGYELLSNLFSNDRWST